MILIIDNYDSFTMNLVHRMGEFKPHRRIMVVRHDELSVRDVEAIAPTHLVISPGPCTPSEAGISVELVKSLAGRIPILGVCLGHQCIGTACGMMVHRAPRLVHGKTSAIHHVGNGLFAGLPNPLVAARYHSLILCETELSRELEATAWTAEGELMGIRHRRYALDGVQFHPESFLTPLGPQLLANFLAHQSADRAAAFPETRSHPRCAGRVAHRFSGGGIDSPPAPVLPTPLRATRGFDQLTRS